MPSWLSIRWALNALISSLLSLLGASEAAAVACSLPLGSTVTESIARDSQIYALKVEGWDALTRA